MASCSAQPAYASTKTATFNCGGVALILSASTESPVILGSIPQYRGTWVEVPSTEAQNVKLFNIDTEELALVGLDGGGKTFLQIYKSVDAFHQHKPEHSSSCGITYG